MKQISVSELNTAKLFEKIGNQWMLIGASDKDGNCNFMTASWGGLGVLWNKNVAMCYIRPTRYTMNFTQASDYFTLSFYPPEKHGALSICGTKSGRDCDKLKLAGLTKQVCNNAVYCDSAELVICCRKIYAQDLSEACFIDKTIIEKDYPLKDYHKMYIGEIETVYVKDYITNFKAE